MSFAEKLANEDLARYQAYYQHSLSDNEADKVWYSVDLARMLAEAPDLNMETCDLAIRQDGLKDETEDLLHGNAIYQLREEMEASWGLIDQLGQKLKSLPTKADLLIVLSYYYDQIRGMQERLAEIEREAEQAGPTDADDDNQVDLEATNTLDAAIKRANARKAYGKVLKTQQSIVDSYDRMLLVNYQIKFQPSMILDPVPSEAEFKAAEERIMTRPVKEPPVRTVTTKSARPLTLDQALAAGLVQPLPEAIWRAKLHDWYYWDVAQALMEELALPLNKGPHHDKQRAAITVMKKYIGVFEALLQRFPPEEWVDC